MKFEEVQQRYHFEVEQRSLFSSELQARTVDEKDSNCCKKIIINFTISEALHNQY